ncbi:MAG: MerR family transcriptional regulator [Planctomycetes bacterium]|nr:MerR family transcriptional regulator [Planctomycetota bacterium]
MSNTGGIRIGELARRAGVPVSTVQHYLREGLLPPPVERGRNTARYSEDSVERVRLIKELQRGAYLPLRVLRQVTERTGDPGELRRYLRMPALRQRLAANGLEPVPEASFLEDRLFRPAELARLARGGLVSPLVRRGRRYYRADDAELLRTLGRMRRSGLTRERGFHLGQLDLYWETLERLARQEVATALEALVGRMPAEELERVAEEVLDLANELVSILHRKAVARVLAELGRGGPTRASPRGRSR